jgi:hypothetical protein
LGNNFLVVVGSSNSFFSGLFHHLYESRIVREFLLCTCAFFFVRAIILSPFVCA